MKHCQLQRLYVSLNGRLTVTDDNRTLWNQNSHVRFVFRAVKIQVDVFWVMMPRSVAAGYQRFRGLHCLHLSQPVIPWLKAVRACFKYYSSTCPRD